MSAYLKLRPSSVKRKYVILSCTAFALSKCNWHQYLPSQPPISSVCVQKLSFCNTRFEFMINLKTFHSLFCYFVCPMVGLNWRTSDWQPDTLCTQPNSANITFYLMNCMCVGKLFAAILGFVVGHCDRMSFCVVVFYTLIRL